MLKMYNMYINQLMRKKFCQVIFVRNFIFFSKKYYWNKKICCSYFSNLCINLLKNSFLVERHVRQSFLIKKFKENDKLYGYG